MAKHRHKPFGEFLKQKQTQAEFRVLFEAQRIKLRIARLIRAARIQRGWTQAELARRIGTTQSVIARLESASDDREPSLRLLGRLAAALGFRLALNFEKAGKSALKSQTTSASSRRKQFAYGDEPRA
jgi:transcriptional regulator with XRE-family HTH domain